MRAILIDPFHGTASEVDDDFTNIDVLGRYLATGNLGEFRAPLGTGPRFASNIMSFVDDEGYFREGQHWFSLAGYPHPLAGRMLVTGLSPKGNTVDLPNWFTPITLKGRVQFIAADDAERRLPPHEIWSGESMDTMTLQQSIPVDISIKRPMPRYVPR